MQSSLYFASLATLGIDQAIFSLRNVSDLEPFDILATEIVPAVETIAVAGRPYSNATFPTERL